MVRLDFHVKLAQWSPDNALFISEDKEIEVKLSSAQLHLDGLL